MVLAEKQTHGPVEQNQESRNKPIFIWTNNFEQKCKKYTVAKGKLLQKVVLGKLESHLQKNETRLLSITTHQNSLKMD